MENNTIPPMYPAEFVERELGIRTDCYNHSCPFRVNDTSGANRCECTACPNRCTGDFSIAWNRTLTDEELEIIERIVNDHERRWHEMPAADVVEVRHGRWEPGNPICPVCGENKFKDLDADVWADWQPKFCPNCGARMGKEDEHEAG